MSWPTKCCSVHDRRGERQQLGGQTLHRLGDLEARDAVAHQRLVDVEVEELDLGVGDLGQRLPVHAHELEEGDEREARVEHRRHVAQELEVLLADLLERLAGEAGRGPDPLDQRRLEPALARRLGERARAHGGREEILQVAVGEPAGARRLAQGVERVPALAQARDDARVRDRRGRPLAVDEHDAVADPAAERGRRDVDLARDVTERQSGHGPEESESGGTAVVAPPPAGNAARCLGRRRSLLGDALRVTREPPTSRPFALVRVPQGLPRSLSCVNRSDRPLTLRRRGGDTGPRRTPCNGRRSAS
jgi:hypothetical protein